MNYGTTGAIRLLSQWHDRAFPPCHVRRLGPRATPTTTLPPCWIEGANKVHLGRGHNLVLQPYRPETGIYEKPTVALTEDIIRGPVGAGKYPALFA